MCAPAKYKLSRDGVPRTSEMRHPSGLMGLCGAVCMDACMITRAWKAAPQCMCSHFCTSWTCHLQTLASVYVIVLNDDQWILWMSFECWYCFLCGIASNSLLLISTETLWMRPGSHLFSIKTAERVLHHCNYDLLSVYMGSLVLTHATPRWVELSDK